MSQQLHPTMSKAITHIIWSIEFFASLVPRLEFLKGSMDTVQPVPTMATDYRRVWYNVDFIESLTMYEVAGCILHEVLHCAMLHNSRRGSRDPWLWNVACDYAINLIIEEISNVALPQGVLLDKKYANMTAERIYDLLVEEQTKSGKAPGEFTLQGDMLPPEGGESQTATDEQDWKAAVSHATNAAKKAGNMPGGLEQLFEPLLHPKLPWRQILENFLNKPKPGARSWNRLNKRYLSRGLKFPTIRYERTGDLVMSGDTSGSMDNNMVQVVFNQVAYVVSIIKPNSVTLIQHDAQIQDIKKFEHDDEFPSGIDVHGRGGTDFRPVFEYVDENFDEPPSALIMLTDGYGPWPTEAPEYPVLWILVDSPELEDDLPYGEVACIDSKTEHF